MLPVLLESSIRAVLVAAGTSAVLTLLRIKSAAARHAAWTATVVVMLLLPAWTVWAPKANIRALPPVPALGPVHPADNAGRLQIEALPFAMSPGPFRPALLKHAGNWPTILLGVYLAGVVLMLFRLISGIIGVSLLVRTTRCDEGLLTHRSCSAPITVGWWRPRIILPESWRFWPEDKRNAVLAHEQEHARRRDPLVQWLALLNRAVFWFHPLAWRLERRLAVLAEEVCDSAVLTQGHDPRDYSVYLLDMARLVEESGSRICAAQMPMPGSCLDQRVRSILAGRPSPRTSRARLASAATAGAILAVLFTTGSLGHLRAQVSWPPPAGGPAFEDVSIETTPTYHAGDFSPWQYRPPAPGMMHYWHQNLRTLVGEAFGVEDYQIEGARGWTDAKPPHSYTITAKKPRPEAPQSTVREMLQKLLAERFHLVLHREQKYVPMYYLVAAPDAMQGIPAEAEDKSSSYAPGVGHFIARKVRLSRLAFALSRSLPRPVIDKTNLDGAYSFDLVWDADVTEQTRNRWPRSGSFDPSPNHPLAPTLVAALDRFGLRLEPQDLLMDVIVIDHADEPSSRD